ncbi:MAG: alpha/beta fold hydrolase [Gemmatimonadota bacterium]|nr:alpha/beta fold hydrolase [Gemmatimonadota bacterium]
MSAAVEPATQPLKPLAGIPTLLLWGMQDRAFGPEDLARWRDALPRADVVEFSEAGHFVQEEAPDEAIAAIRRFLASILS